MSVFPKPQEKNCRPLKKQKKEDFELCSARKKVIINMIKKKFRNVFSKV